MNYLAHSFLSFGYHHVMLGNFIADTIRGVKPETYNQEIQKGIQLHHYIDSFTDHHPTVKQSKNRLSDKYGHYDSIIIDILYDYFLAINWQTYSEIKLEEHAQMTYKVLTDNYDLIPDKLKHALPSMIGQNWLVAYGTKEGIATALKGMTKRASFDSHMDEAMVDLETHYELLENDFKQFFPQLLEGCKKQLGL